MAELEIKASLGMRARVAGLMLGAFVIAGVLVWLLTGGGVGLFARKSDVKTFMPDATGLEIGSPVRMDGIQIGTVKNIEISGYLDKQRAVLVSLRVDSKFLPKIPADSVTSIGADTLIGNKFVDIAEGKNPIPVAEGGALPSEPASTAADKADLILGLQDSLRKVDNMLTEITSPDTQMGQFVMGEKEYDSVLRQVAGFERGMRSVVAPSSAVGQALFTMDLYDKIHKPVVQIDNTLQAIQRGEGVAGKLYASDEQYNAILVQIQDLRKTIVQMRTDIASKGEGLRDEEAYQKVRSMLASTDAMLATLNRGEGRAGELLTSPQLYESLAGSLKNIEDMLRDLRGNPKKYLRVKLR
jgi:phospholipid/cholesterol/gamma-HCH transport system substrate-binding protein